MPDRQSLAALLPLGLAMALVGASFGAVAVAAGVSLPQVLALSVVVYAGGAQFLVVAAVVAGAAPAAVVFGGLLLNARHLPYGLVLADVLRGSWPSRIFGAHLMTDEATAFTTAELASHGDVARARKTFFAAGITLFLAWNVGTAIGAVGGNFLGDPNALGIDAAFPAALLALTAGAWRTRVDRRVALLGAAVAVVATPVLPAGLGVIAGLLGLIAAGRGR
ncbi:AzlC family ABC transporter permease [Rhodococcus sp. OK302]|uniref:AzlC family ABC transporter permease n=1 Tax=Rhodococcus sp. OK302 TaxID=1882769 RepID=UPI000B9F77AB|nr:AzlC family ABC transporter permease [Rhodococcus sp. OK302]OYD69801.1 4-azaleucine resistance transporter AzlC [Rhodococcus sp. OK302]